MLNSYTNTLCSNDVASTIFDSIASYSFLEPEFLNIKPFGQHVPVFNKK